VFPHLGVRGWKEDYKGICPFWRISYFLPLWAEQVKIIARWDWKILLNIPPYVDLGWFPLEYVNGVMRLAVMQGMSENNYWKIIDIVKEMPCHDDFEPRHSRVGIDFLRKWNHTRAKMKMLSLEGCLEDPNSKIHRIGDENKAGLEEQVEARDNVARFMALIPKKDRLIIKMRMDGYTYEEIAEKLSYSNHSGVIKRIKIIQAKYEGFEKKELEELSEL